MAQANPVGWFELYVQDLQRARTFYERVLGLELQAMDAPEGSPDMLFFPGGMERFGATGALCRMQGAPSGPGGTLVYFACDDCAVQAARVVEAGGRVHTDKKSIGPYGFIALAFDTEGNMIGLHSMQ